MRATESIKFNEIDATTAGFALYGGRYLLLVVATWGGGSVAVESLAPDASWIAVPNVEGDAVAGDGAFHYDLPPGQYRLALTTATDVLGALTRIPLAE